MLIQLQIQIIIKSKMSDKNNYNRKTLDLETKMKVVNKSKNVSQRKLASLFNCSKTQICRIL